MEIDDRLLEEALATYSRQEPGTGLEQRVLAGVASRRARPPWMWPVCLFATACLVAMVSTSRRESTPVAPPAPVAPVKMAAQPPAIPPRRAPPRREQFPSPAPLTPEEQAWMTLADGGFVADVSAAIEPIRIDELTIPPLESEGGE